MCSMHFILTTPFNPDLSRSKCLRPQCGYPVRHYCCCSVTLWDLMGCSTSGFPVLHHLLEFPHTHIESVILSSHLILGSPFLCLPSIFPSIRVFSNTSALHIRWSKYWSFSISPSNEYPGLISFRLDWCYLLVI